MFHSFDLNELWVAGNLLDVENMKNDKAVGSYSLASGENRKETIITVWSSKCSAVHRALGHVEEGYLPKPEAWEGFSLQCLLQPDFQGQAAKKKVWVV